MKFLSFNPALIQAFVCIWITFIHTDCVKAQHQLRLNIIENKVHSGKIEKYLRFIIISDHKIFIETYRRMHSLELPQPKPPEIDFDTHRVLVAFMGQKPTSGYTISFDDVVVLLESMIEVKVRLARPPRDAILAQVMTNPYVMAIIEKGSYTRVKFVNEAGEVLAVLTL